MKRIAMFLGAMMLSLGLSAAVKTVTWSLPGDWEGRLELDQICEPVGAPSVAYYTALVEVPSAATNFVVTASDVAYRASERARPTPVLEPAVVGEPLNAPVEDAALYASVFPSDVFEKGEPWEMGGKTVLPVRIKVYRWNGPENKVEALSSLKLSIACESPRATLKLTTSAVPTAKVDYIVISPHNYVSYWNKFVEYRRTTHPSMTFEIVDCDDIYAKYTTGDDALKIHHFIEDMYKLGTRYVLLGAGVKKDDYAYNNKTMIPTRVVISEKSQTQNCDYYFCVVDKPSGAKEVWDYNGDGIYLASKNPNGGYYTDATSQFSWTGSMKVHRFPARDTVSLGGKSRSAQQQIEGYVEKLKRYEQGLFQGRFSQSIMAATLSEGYNVYHGNTSDACTMERQFYDLGANIFSEEHGSTISMNEHSTRERGPSYFTLKRPVGYNRSVLQLYYSNGENANTFYGRNFESLVINSHGSPDAVDPLTRAGVFNATGLCAFYIMCVPCHAGNPTTGPLTSVSIAEAGVVNPEGGSLVAFGNSHYGRWGGKDVLSEKIERDVIKMLYACQDNNYNDAGTSRLWSQNNYKWNNLSPNSAGGMIMCDSMAYGDPLVKLTPIYSRVVDSDGTWHRGDQLSTPSDQEFASGLTINATAGDQTITFTNAVGAANLTINGTSGKTLTLAASGNGKFKVSNTVTVNNGMTLNWDVPGGFARNGINMANGGNLRLRAEGYYGTVFQGMNSLTVAPPANKTAILDFDTKNYFRNTKTGPITVSGPGETIFRSRQAGIFSTDFTVAVNGGTLTLETPCVGGSGSQSSTTPLFNVKNATLAVRPNPYWTPECFSRRVSFENGTLNSRYDKFYLGPNVSGYPGLDVTVDGLNNVFQGTSPIRLNGQLRIHSTTGGVVNITGELVNGNGTGSLKLDNKVTAKLAAVNTFSGGITVPSGARLVVDHVRGLSTGSVVVQSGGVLQMNEMPLAGVKSVTLQSGAKLVLKSKGSGSYQMYSPSTTSFTIADGVKVYDSTNESVELDGIVTPEGAYFISDAAKYWGNISGKSWKNDPNVLAWNKKGETDPLAYADGDTVLFRNITGASSTTVPVEGNVNPGMMAFQNTDTAYNFTGSGTITVGSMATAGTTSFQPSIRATSQVSVGGKTAVNNITTPIINVAGGGALNVGGTVTGIDTIRVIRMKITDTMGPHNTTPRTNAPELSELQFFDTNGNYQFFPIGTEIKDSVGNTTTISGRNGNAYVFSNSNSLKNLFDGNTGTYHMIGSNITGPWTITLTFPDNNLYPMFGKFKYGRAKARTPSSIIYAAMGNYPDANPRSWEMYAGDSESSLTKVCSNSAIDGTASSLTGFYSVSSWTSKSKATVQSGGTLYLNGTYNVPLTINSGVTLAVTNNSKLTFGAAKTIPTGTYAMTLDATQAQKSSNYFQVTSGGGFSSIWQVQTADDVAAKIDGGNLWIATSGVMPPPYARTISGKDSAVTWNTADWRGKGDTAFANVWGSVITKPSGSATLNVTGTNLTMNIDCAVNLDTLKVTTPTNCYPKTFTATGSSALGISALDFRDFNGKVCWNPALASWGTHVYVGTNEVTIASMTSGVGNLQIGAGGKATFPAKFASYDVDATSYLRITGTHSFSVDSDLPNKGIQSFNNTTFSGGFQKSAVTYLVENGDTLTFTGNSDNYYGRMSSSFDIRGGSVTINSNGATTWFGINGETSFVQTNGTFKCTANDTSMSASNSGFLVGYSSSKTENFEFDISGGRFELPNTYINFYGPAKFNLTSNGVVQAKGVYKGSNNKGAITVNEGSVFEIGTIGLVAGACDFNLYGGTLAGFENGARTRSAVNLVGVGTLAARANTTFTIDAGTINTDGATLNIGKAGYTGTVKFSASPAGVTNYNVVAGTWDLGALRPTAATISQMGDGLLKLTLSNDELVQAATTGLAVFKTSLPASAFTNKIKIYTPNATELNGISRVENGNLVVSVGYVYPLKAVAKADTVWENLDWVDSIGMTYLGNWSDVTGAELTNTLSGVTLAVPTAFTTSLKVVNAGTLTINGENALATLDDSLSTGITTIGFTANNVAAGAETVVKKAGTGTLTLANGKCAALWNNLTWGGTISGFSGTAKIKYVGDETLTSLNYTSDGAGVVAYAQKVAINGDMAFANKLTRNFEDGLDAKVTRFVMGNNATSGQTGQTFRQTGGKIVVTGDKDMTGGGDPTSSTITQNAPLLFSHWNNPVAYYLAGGELIATNGINGSLYFGRDGVPKLYIGGGNTKATLRTNGLINDSRDAKDKNGSVLELLPNGYLEIGNKNFVLYRNAELKMSGGTFLAYENAEILSDTSKFTLTENTASCLAAAAGKTLTVSKVPTGTGTLTCGDDTNNGTVILKGGSYANLTLGGTFTIRLTADQQSATLDVPLFKAAADLNPDNVTVVKNDGTAIEGVKSVKDGKLCWAPASGYMQPIVATVSGSKDWLDLDWKDSSPTPREVPDEFWTSYTTASVKLTVEGEAAITEPSSAITVATTEVTGAGRLALPNSANLTLGTVKGDGTIVCDGFCKVYTGLDASAWTGTYVLTNQSAASGANAGTKLGYTFAGLGNAGSVVEISGVSGWFDGCSTCVETPFKGTEHHYTLKIGPGGLNLNDGSSNQGYCFDKLVGAGNLTVGKASDGPSSRVIALDATEYAGLLKASGNGGIILGTPSATTGNGTIAIDGQYNVAYGTARLTAANGVTVRANGVLNLLQTDASQKTWPITGNALTVNGRVTVNGAPVLSRNWKVDGGSIVLRDELLEYPSVLESSYLWLDATESASITTGDSGEVQSWKSVVGDKSAAKYSATGVTAGPTVTQNAFNGNAVVDFGVVGSGKDLSFTRATTIKAVFMVVDIAQTQGAFLLGDGTTFHFHRGSGGNYFSGNPPAEIKTNGKTYRNGVLVADPVNTKIPTGYGLVEVIPQDTSTQICAERICADRNCSDSNVYRNGGKKVGELIILTTAPTDAERRAIENYLMGKWGFGYSATLTATPAEFTTGEGVDVLGGYSAGADFTVKNPSVANATFNIGQAITVGAFTVNAAQPLTITANGGSVTATSINDSASAAKTVLDFATLAAPITAGADTVLTRSGTGAITVAANKKVTLGDGVTTGAITVNATGTVRREGTITGSDNFSTLMASDGYYEFKNAVITGNMESKTLCGRKLIVREGDSVTLTTTGSHNATDISVYVHGGALRYTTAATWFASDVYYVQDGGTVVFDATGDGTANNAAVIPGYTGGNKTASMAISGGLTDISKTSIRFDQTSAITVSGTGTLKVKGINGNTSNQHPITVSEQGTLLIGGNNWKTGVGSLTLNGGTLGAFENAAMEAASVVSSASTMCAANGATLTVSGVVSGAGGLAIGEAEYAGTVKFTAAPTYTGATTLAYGTLEVPSGALKGNVTINAGTTLNLTGTAGASSYVVTAGNVSFGDGASIANITLNGKALEGNWELVNGTLVERYEVISVNIGGGENGSGSSPNGYLVAGDVAVGLEAVPGKYWNNVDGRWASGASVKSRTIIAGKAYNRTAEVSRPSVKVTASANNTYGYSSATTAFFKGYLDDGGDHAHITVEGIPYPRYDVIVYGTADSGSYKLAPITVNGESYTWNGSETVKGTGTWGATQASTPAYGSNALLIKGLTTTTLTIVGGANASGARGGLAAFQIVNRATNVIESVNFVMTVADSRNLTDYDCTPSPFVPSLFNSLTLNVTAADPVTATIASDLTLEMLAVQSAAGASLTIAKSAGALNVSDYDFSAANGKTTLDFDIGSTPFTVGGGCLAFKGAMNDFDWSAYVGKTIELAGGYSIKADTRLNASTMILSGTGSTSNNENGLHNGARVVIPSGTFTLSQRFVVGQGANDQTMYLDITGGTLASGSDGFMYTGGYSGNTLHTTLSAGSWTANYIVWNDNGATANTFNIHAFGTGLFAPAFIGTVDGSGNKVANDRDVSGGYRHHVYLGNGGAFSVPAVVPNWLEVVVTNGTGTITAQTASSVIRSRVTVDAGTTLDFDLGADNAIEFKNDTKANAALVNNGTVKVSSGTFKLAKGVTLAGDVAVEKGAALDIATDAPEAEEFTVTTGNLVFNGTLKVNGTVKDGIWTGRDGKIVRGELKDFHATLPDGTTSVNFSQIAWDEGTYSSGTNHTVTINAPDGCEIVIDQSITNQSFTVNCTGTCTVRVANDSTVALAQGFLGENYSLFYDNAEYGAVLTAFSLDGSTGWTDNHAVRFYYTLVDPNGLDLVFTGAVDEQSSVSVNDVGNKGGSVTFSNNLTTVDYFFVGNGTARFATTDRVTIGTLSTYELYNGRIVVAAKTDEAPILVLDDWEGVNLTGVTLDIDTFTDEPIPEDVVEYKLFTAPTINTTGVKLGSSFKGNWELQIVQEGDWQTLVARKTKKGFSFIIADVGLLEEQIEAIHDDTSKHALDIDRDWVAQKAGLTETEKQDDDEVAFAINTEGANGAKLYESYVLGLEPTDAASKPVPAPVQTESPTQVGFKLANVAVNPRAGANSVKFAVYSSDTVGGEKTLVTDPIPADEIAKIDLPQSGVRYYHLEVLVN